MTQKADGTCDNTFEWVKTKDQNNVTDYRMEIYHPAAYNMSDDILEEFAKRKLKLFESYDNSSRHNSSLIQYDNALAPFSKVIFNVHHQFLANVFKIPTTSDSEGS